MTMTGARPASGDADGTSGAPTQHWMVLAGANEWQTRHGSPAFRSPPPTYWILSAAIGWSTEHELHRTLDM